MSQPHNNIIFRIRSAVYIIGIITCAYAEYIHSSEIENVRCENSWIPLPWPADWIPHPILPVPETLPETS